VDRLVDAMEILILNHMVFKDQRFEEENISKKPVNMFIGKGKLYYVKM
jgi:hypothetical protein